MRSDFIFDALPHFRLICYEHFFSNLCLLLSEKAFEGWRNRGPQDFQQKVLSWAKSGERRNCG
jgi:hypothetical protein